jgi:hypothetical protein
MFETIFSVFHSIRQGFRSRAALHAEILALRHQLLVLQRSRRSHKVQLGVADRIFWVWLSQLWNGWRSALAIVKPETVIAWHRRGFRLYWSWKSRHRQGRPSVSREVIDLIRKMSMANPRWGAPRIHGELLKLGFDLSESTVAKYMIRHRKPLCLAKMPLGFRIKNLQMMLLGNFPLYLSHVHCTKALSGHNWPPVLHASWSPSGKSCSATTTRGAQAAASETKIKRLRQIVLGKHPADLVRLEKFADCRHS